VYGRVSVCLTDLDELRYGGELEHVHDVVGAHVPVAESKRRADGPCARRAAPARSMATSAPLRIAALTLETHGRRAWRSDCALELTAREFDLLTCLMQHAGQVLPHSVLLEQVWGHDFESESNALEVYVAYLRGELNAADEPDLIHAMRGVGYVLREQRRT
jgi:DNA-binding response OmpR family regulator